MRHATPSETRSLSTNKGQLHLELANEFPSDAAAMLGIGNCTLAVHEIAEASERAGGA